MTIESALVRDDLASFLASQIVGVYGNNILG